MPPSKMEWQICTSPLHSSSHEKAATAAMVKHGMTVLCWATEFLNPGQIPVMAFDAPLFVLVKLVQWKWPDTHGEEKFIAMFGDLHIDIAMWTTYGDFLEGSGWTNTLTQAGVAYSGTSDSFLHLTRTRHAHQVTALSLGKLQDDAFLHAQSEETKEKWRQKMIQKSATFQYWDTILSMEILDLIFIRSHHEGSDFSTSLRYHSHWVIKKLPTYSEFCVQKKFKQEAASLMQIIEIDSLMTSMSYWL